MFKYLGYGFIVIITIQVVYDYYEANFIQSFVQNAVESTVL